MKRITNYELRITKKNDHRRFFQRELFSIRNLFFLLTLAVLSGCYSFTGASLPSYLHTIAIPLVEDNSGFGQPDVRQNLTDNLIQKFTNEGSLRVANVSNADAVLEVSIPSNGILDESVSVRPGDQTTTKRVTLHVHAIYRDQKKQKLFWENDFTQSSDYPISQNLAGLRTALHDAEDKLSETLLIAAISNW
ncbi:MAG TPA: LptE family protein [Candidatus Kapabacteria bacterium]|jgi:hypothetical protein|nr:LptE family protein [Candidatus Kapabacteria bacterium]